jgi:hypothetical protein
MNHNNPITLQALSERTIRNCLLCITVFTAFLSPCETTSATDYERGTIIAVQQHQNTSPKNTGATQYEVSIQVRNVVYVALYTPPHGANSVEYATGIDVLVLVDDDSLKVPSKLSGTLELPILSKKVLPPQPTPDWSKAPSQYFAMKMQHLSEVLNLSNEQRAKVKPIAQQETGEVGPVIFSPVLSREERLNRWEAIVRKSDAKMKPFLSQAQWEKLQQVRSQQKGELKQLVEEADARDKR